MINIKRIELEHVYNLLTKYANEKFDPKFTYFVIRNLMLLKSEMNCIQDFRNKMIPTEKLIEFSQKENLINLKYIHKDNNNNNIVYKDENSIVRPYCGDNKEFYDNEIDGLKEQFSDTLIEWKKVKTDVTALLEESIDIVIATIDYAELPTDIFTGNELLVLYKFIKMEEDK